MNPKRLTWLDMAKGYGILFVMLGHLTDDNLYYWIYSFHLPMFFILSGFVFKADMDFKTFFKKKVKSIIVPYFCLALPMSIFYTIQQAVEGKFTGGTLIYAFLGPFAQLRLWTIWYLACLFVVNLMFYGTVKWLKTEGKLAIAAVIITSLGLTYYFLGGPIIPWCIDAAVMAYPFFFIGYLCKQHKDKIESVLSQKKYSVPIFFGAWIVNAICFIVNMKITGRGLEMYYGQYGFAPLTLTAAVAGTLGIVCLSHWFTCKPIQYVGENSMLYFAWHQTIMIPITEWILDAAGLTILPLYIALQIAMMLIVLTLFNMLISKSKLKFILGK